MRSTNVAGFVLALLLAVPSLALAQTPPSPEKAAPVAPTSSPALDEAKRLYAQVEALYAQGKFDEAIPLALHDIELYERALGPDHPDVANAQHNLGALYVAKAEFAKAEPIYLRSLAILEGSRGPEHPDVASVLMSLAALRSRKEEFSAAEPLLLRSLAIREKALGPDDLMVALSLNELGLIYWKKGDFARAQPTFERALAIAEKKRDQERDIGQIVNNLAMIYYANGDYARAEATYQRALAMKEALLGPEHVNLANTLNNLGELYRTTHDYTRAEAFYERALAIRLKAFGPESTLTAVILDNQGLLACEMGDYEKGEPKLKQAYAIYEKKLGKDSPRIAPALINLASARAAQGDYVQAEAMLQRAIAIRERSLTPQSPRLARPLHLLSTLYLDTNDVDRALQAEARALALEDRSASILLSTGSDEQKRAFVETLRDSTDSALSLHTQAAPGSRLAKELALTTILRRKGRVVDAITDSFAALRRSSDPETRGLLDELRAIDSEYASLVYRKPAEQAPKASEPRIAELDEKRQALEARLSHRGAALQAEIQPVTLEQIQAAIPEGAVLVEIVKYRPSRPKVAPKARFSELRYVAYAVRRRGEAAWADLGEARAIDEATDKLRRALSDPDLSHDPKPAGRALDALVMQPIRKLLNNDRWVFMSPDGALNLVPFGAMVDDAGRFAAERYLFTYVTSGRDLLRLKEPAAPSQGALLFADPAFDSGRGVGAPVKATPDEGLRSVDVSRIRFSPLPSTAKEASAIKARLADAQVLSGASASEAAIKAVHGPRILHIATHGFFLPIDDAAARQAPAFGDEPGARAFGGPPLGQNPLLRSGLGLAGANERSGSSGDDGILTALEVSSLDLRGTKLAVLSACETAVGEASSGEGVYGLRRSLIVAGAETQVMSLWKVDTGVTRELMVAYYDQLNEGAGRSEAMWRVQLAMLAKTGRAHPNLWAAFIVSGNPSSLDGRSSAPDFAKVAPGPRGCACEATGARGERGFPAAAYFVGLLWLGAAARWRRR